MHAHQSAALLLPARRRSPLPTSPSPTGAGPPSTPAWVSPRCHPVRSESRLAPDAATKARRRGRLSGSARMLRHVPISLSTTESRLAEALSAGSELDLSSAADREVRALVVRELVRGVNSTIPAIRAHFAEAEPDPRGLRLRGAIIAGRINLDRVVTTVPLNLVSCRIPDGFSAHDAQLRDLALENCELGEVQNGAPLFGNGIRIERNLTLSGLRAKGGGLYGAVSLSGARVGAQVALDAAELRNDFGPALSAAGLHVEGRLFLVGLFAVGSTELGAMRLAGAIIGGQLDARTVRIVNTSGPALAAGGLRVAQNLDLSGARLEGSGNLSTMRMQGAHVGAFLSLDDAVLENPSGPAWFGDNLRVAEQITMLRLHAVGNSDAPAISLRGASTAGDLLAAGLTVTNEAGSALACKSCHVGQDANFDQLHAEGNGSAAVVSLYDMRVDGRFSWSDTVVTSRLDPMYRLEVDGLQYTGLPVGPEVHEWLSIIRWATSDYSAQPYRALTSAAQAAGHERQMRDILMRQRRDQIDRASTTWAERAWASITHVTLGYGYQPWRALVFLFIVILLSVALNVSFRHSGLGHVSMPGARQSDCSLSETVISAVDIAVPLVSTEATSLCGVTASAQGQLLAYIHLIVQLAGWAFATLFVAGFTAAVRKT